MATPAFKYQDPFPLGQDTTPYRLLTKDHVSVEKFDGEEVLKVEPEGSRCSPRRRCATRLLPAPRAQRAGGQDPRRPGGVAATTGAWRSPCCATPRSPPTACCPSARTPAPPPSSARRASRSGPAATTRRPSPQGVYKTYTEENLRYSQTAPLDHVRGEEHRHQPAGADRPLRRPTATEYQFLFVAKGGGSANKTFLYQETKALLNPETLEKFLVEKMKSLGTAACPPYHLAFVIGGTSAETCLKTVKLASRQLPRRPAHQRATSTAGPSATSSWRRSSCRPRSRLRHRRAVRRQVLRPRRARHPPAAPRRLLPGRHGRLLLGRPQHQGQDQQGRHLPRAAGAATRAASSRTSTAASTSHGRCKIDLNRPMEEILAELSQAPGHARGSRSPARIIVGARHRPRQAQGAARRRARACPTTSRTTRSTTPARPRRPRACPPARSARPPPGAWTPTSTSSSRTAARWS